MELVETSQVPGSKSVLQLCLVIKSNGDSWKILCTSSCPSYQDAALEGIITDVRSKDVGAFYTTLLLPDTLVVFTHSLSQPKYFVSLITL